MKKYIAMEKQGPLVYSPSSVALKVASESWCEKNKNKNKNKNNNEEGTAESVKGQRAVAPLTLILCEA